MYLDSCVCINVDLESYFTFIMYSEYELLAAYFCPLCTVVYCNNVCNLLPDVLNPPTFAARPRGAASRMRRAKALSMVAGKHSLCSATYFHFNSPYVAPV